MGLIGSRRRTTTGGLPSPTGPGVRTSRPLPRPGPRPLAAAVAGLLVLGAGLAAVVVAHADEPTVSVDPLRTAWDAAEPGLSPANVRNPSFGLQFKTQLDGQVYAQPVVAAGTLIAVTENDKAYGLDPATGAIRWTRDVGPFWPAAAIGCGDLTPNIGITSTPVYDPASGAVYFMAKANDGPDTRHPHWYLHAVDPGTGTERTGFPVTIAGSPSNDPTASFDAYYQMQRPGLLLLDGVVYAGFASLCDLGPYRGYVVGVSTRTAKVTAIWASESGASNTRGGIWQSGGGLVSDGPGRILFATGNGISPPAGPGTRPPGTLAESVVRLQVSADGSLSAADFFSPADAPTLDLNDTDLGSGGPVALPASFGTAAHPHLLVESGKDGRVFLLDRDNLGGRSQGPGETDAALGVTGPFQAHWGHPAVWGGDGGYVYLIGDLGPMRALKYGVTGAGLPALTAVGATATSYGYTSGSPVVTSTGTTSGSAVVWVETANGASGAGGLLRAYSAVPDGNGILPQLYSASIGIASKFAVPATDAGRVYVANRSGVVMAFGLPSTAPLTASPVSFGSVAVGATGTATAVLTASRALTVSAISASAPFAATPGTLPQTVAAGGQLSVPVSFAPTAPGGATGSLTVSTDQGTVDLGLQGTGVQPGLHAAPAAVTFSGQPTGTTNTLNVQVTNTGTDPETITGVTLPAAPFTATGLPATGTVVAPGGSFVVSMTYAPTAAASDSSSLAITSTTGTLTIPVAGTGLSGQGKLVLTPTALSFGSVPVGGARTLSFSITNTGNVPVTITAAKPPAGAFASAVPLPEGLVLGPGAVAHQAVTFSPTSLGARTSRYQITGNAGQGTLVETLTGVGSAAKALPRLGATGWRANGAARISGTSVTLTLAGHRSTAGSLVSTRAVSPLGVMATFTERISGTGPRGADGLTFALLNASGTSVTSLGATGAGLGVGRLPATFVSLNTYPREGIPGRNYVAVGTSRPGTTSLNLLDANPSIPTLRGATHRIGVRVTMTRHVIVTIDGRQVLDVLVPTLPPRVRIAFTAGTGSQTDTHLVSAPVISYLS